MQPIERNDVRERHFLFADGARVPIRKDTVRE